MGVEPKLFNWLALAKMAVLFLLAAGGANALGQGFSFESAGARFGAPIGESGLDFMQAEAFVDWNLPWRWDLGAQWRLDMRLELSAGWLGSGPVNAAVGTLGPSLVLQRALFPISLESGISPTLLSEHDLESKNFGTPIQFTTHVAIDWDFATHFRMVCRFQHMSNGGLSHHNPGLNLYMFGLSYRF